MLEVVHIFIDAHFHLGYSPSFHYYDTTVDHYLQFMERRNISYCMNIHSIGLITDELELGMEENIRAFEQSKGRILSYYTFNPNCGKRSIEVMDRYCDRMIFKAIKLHPSIHGVYADDSRYEAAWEYAANHGLPIMSHTWALSAHNPSQKYSYPPLFEKYIAKYPSVNFICGHSGGRYDGILKTIKLAKTYPNVYMDTSGDVYNNRLVEFLCEQAGSEKVLFGSDGFWVDARSQLGIILDADIPLADKENVLYKNARQLFRV